MAEEINTYHNKQDIRTRMLDLATVVQGVNRPESLDPFVTLFVESLAEEIYHLCAEVDNLEARVLNRLSSILVSNIRTIASPSHSLLHVSPREPVLELTVTDPFLLVQQSKRQDELSLYPVCNTPVYHGGIRYFIYERYLFSMDRELTKTLITRRGAAWKEQHAAPSFWIGLELDDSIHTIENLSFYLSLSDGFDSPENLKQLLHSKWKCGGADISIRKGLYSKEEETKNPVLDMFGKLDNARRINREIKKQYDGHYITIDGPLDITAKKEVFPTPLISCFPPDVCSGFTKALLWFEIIAPADFAQEMIRAIRISINIVPVSCKWLVSKMVQVNRELPVIPLKTRANEFFLSVHSLSDSTGIDYYDIPLGNPAEEKHGVYTLRCGGYERFARNDAKEFLANITNLINREASSLFKRNSESKEEQTALQEGINAMIRHLTQTVSSAKQHTEVTNYLVIDQQCETEIYFLKYWTAVNLALDTIKENTEVRPCPELPVHPAGVYLISPPAEGKPTPTEHEKYNVYRKSLTEHPLLITPKDIRKFCMEEFSEIVEQVEVGMGHKKNTGPGTGFFKTTDVYLHIRKYGSGKADTTIREYMEQVLRDHSPATYHYRVILK